MAQLVGAEPLHTCTQLHIVVAKPIRKLTYDEGAEELHNYYGRRLLQPRRRRLSDLNWPRSERLIHRYRSTMWCAVWSWHYHLGLSCKVPFARIRKYWGFDLPGDVRRRQGWKKIHCWQYSEITGMSLVICVACNSFRIGK